MIPLSKMNYADEESYYQAVSIIIDRMKSFPFSGIPKGKHIEKLDEMFKDLLGISFKEFLLAPYEDLCKYKTNLSIKGLAGIIEIIKRDNQPDEILELTYLQAYRFSGVEILFYKLFVTGVFEKFSSKIQYINKILNVQKLNIWIAKKHDLLVCPYCNINYIYSRNNMIFGAQLDHFFAKEANPIFAICLYNLIPSCSTCNNAKRTNVANISPFNDNIDFNKILKFSYRVKDVEFVMSPDSIEVYLKYIGTQGMLLHQDMIPTGVQEAYKPFNAYVQKILLKSLVYNETAINTLLHQYPELFKSKEEVLSLIYGNDFNDENDINTVYKNQSLSRLTHDLLKELEVL